MIFKPVQENAINYVDITNDGLIGGVQPFAERMEFWDNFYRKHENTLKQAVVETIKDEL